MSTTVMTDEIKKAINSVDTTEMIAVQSKKGIQASKEMADRIRNYLEDELAVANFDLVEEINQKFAEFLRFDGMQERLQMLLEKASGNQESRGDVEESLDEVMEDIHEINESLSPGKMALESAKFFGGIFRFFYHGFKSNSQVFVYGLRDLKGKVEVVQSTIGTEKIKLRNTVDLVRQYLPEVTEDIIRLEYLDKFLTEFIASDAVQELSEEAQDFLREYQVSLAAMKQVSSVSVIRILLGLNRLVKAKFNLDKTEMRFTMNLGTLVFENLIANQVSHSYSLAADITEGIEKLEKKNEELAKDNAEKEIEAKKKNLDILKSLEGKIEKVKADYAEYKVTVEGLNDEIEDYLPKYQEAYAEVVDLRDKILNREKIAQDAMQKLLEAPAFDEEAVIEANFVAEKEKDKAMDAVTDVAA